MEENFNNHKEYTTKRSLMNFLKLKQFLILLIITIAVVIYITFGIPKSSNIAVDISKASKQQLAQNQIPVGWGLYQNQELGVAFQYPLSWGSIKQGFVSTGCVSKDKVWGGTEYMDYTEEVYNQIKKEMALNPQDPCIMTSINIIDENVPYGVQGERTILGTMSSLYSKYPVQGKGPPWYAAAGSSVSKESLKNLCTKSFVECSTFTNNQGVLIYKEQVSEGMYGEGVMYYIHSPNNVYSGIVMGTLDFSEEQRKDFGSVVDSLYFIK